MSKHSETYESQKNKLKAKEDELKTALEKESDKAEEELFNYLKLMAVTAGASIVGYGIYRLFKKNRKEKVPNENFSRPISTQHKKETTVRTSNSFWDRLKDRASEQLVAAIVSYASGYLTRMQKEESKKGAKD